MPRCGGTGVREAIVIDEYGGTAGLVTFESLMERIVGDLGGAVGGPDRIAVRPDGSADIDGLALATDINERFGLHIDEDTFTTVGGYVLGRIGRRVRLGDSDRDRRRVTMRVVGLDGLRSRESVAVEARKAPEQGGDEEGQEGRRGRGQDGQDGRGSGGKGGTGRRGRTAAGWAE